MPDMSSKLYEGIQLQRHVPRWDNVRSFFARAKIKAAKADIQLEKEVKRGKSEDSIEKQYGLVESFQTIDDCQSGASPISARAYILDECIEMGVGPGAGGSGLHFS